jgi:hypothetical protein
MTLLPVNHLNRFITLYEIGFFIHLNFLNLTNMKSIKFTEQELDFLRTQYQLELVEAEKYVQEVKSLLKKLGVPSTKDDTPEKRKPGRKKKQAPSKEEAPIKTGKRGRKPKVVAPVESVEKQDVKKVKAAKVEKKKPQKKVKPTVENIPIPKPVNEKPKTEIPKKDKPKKKTVRKSYKKRGIVLKNLSKPLPKKELPASEETGPQPE